MPFPKRKKAVTPEAAASPRYPDEEEHESPVRKQARPPDEDDDDFEEADPKEEEEEEEATPEDVGTMPPIFAAIMVGAYAPSSTLVYTWIEVGDVIEPLQGSEWGTPGTHYTVTATIADPYANPNVPSAYADDQLIISDGIGTVSASSLTRCYFVSYPKY